MESLDTGKPLALAQALDIPRAVENFRFYAGAVRHQSTDCHMTGGAPIGENNTAAVNYTQRWPAGVGAIISPWNLPLYLLTFKAAAALGCGCTVVAKPSELTPHTATALCAIMQRVGLPKGVFNLVHGLGAEAGQPLVSHPRVPLVSFTGGTVTGKLVAASAAPMFKKVSLELGGKNASVVFGDCDMPRTAATVARAAFANQGQVCLCGSRIFVEDSAYDRFLPMLLAEVAKLAPADPRAGNFGALISEQHMNKVLSYIALAREEGGEVVCGGERARVPGFEEGFFVQPTVVTGLAPSARCSQEEIFGPVVVVHRFKDEAEVLEHVNGTQYGLAGALFSGDVQRCHRLSARWETGMVWVNCWLLRDLRVPFGGVRASGVGTEGGYHSIDFWSNIKNICIKL
jgi:aminomuconate-semialdehyde/2-hydroxymuconate-6-semialdehyde dehydrogenase